MIGIELYKSVFLLYIVMASGFVGDIFGCRVKKMLDTNIYVKHISFFVMIYFTIILTENNLSSPLDNFYKSLKMWVFYIMLIRLNLTFTLVSSLLLILLYILDEYVIYYKSLNDKDNKKEKKEKQEIYNYIKKFPKYLEYIIGIVVITGFFLYMYKQYKDKGKKFKLKKFIFGLLECGK